jgi:carboxyl-terminal processing protease
VEKKRNRLSNLLPLIIAVSITAGIMLGYLVKFNASQGIQMGSLSHPDKISSILGYIEKNYVDSVDKDDLYDDIIQQILGRLDPHSIYIPPRDLAGVNETLRGNFEGIGVQFNMQDDTILVIQAVRGGPSEKVGILPGDRIVSVNDSIVAGVNMPEDTIVGMLRGPNGTKVDVGVVRKGVEGPISFTITRGKIPLYSVDVSYMMDELTGYIKISNFSQTTYQEFAGHLEKLQEQGCENLIIDLRGNSGGIMSPAINIADMFLDEGKLIVYTQGKHREREDFFATSKEPGKDINLSVLIDESSASASEIVAGAIQDNDRGLIIGRRSFGKGLVQEQVMLSDGSALRLTTARYYSPTGRCIQRDYTDGTEDYYMDFHRRLSHGELVERDSIDLPDSLKFTTPGGRIVYGGGGIMPDYFIPYDTTGITESLMRLTRAGTIYRFALHYSDSNRESLSAFTSPDQVADFLDDKKLLGELLQYAKESGVKLDPAEVKKSEEIIITQLKAYISRNLLDNDGFYPIIQKIDNTLLEALKITERESITE